MEIYWIKVKLWHYIIMYLQTVMFTTSGTNFTFLIFPFYFTSWKSADGGDWACYSCQRQFAPSFRSTQEQSVPPSDPKVDQASSAQRLMKLQPRIQAGSADLVKSGQTSSEAAPSWRSIIIPQGEESESVGKQHW